MTAGVSQGSILGPLLWNLTYNRVLEISERDRHKGCCVVCYADDTIILVRDNDPRDAIAKTNFCVAKVARLINKLGLKIAANKTEAMLFCKKKINIESLAVTIGDQKIPIKPYIKYLGVLIDRNWKFQYHFRYMEEKASKIICALWKLMPNIKGPEETKRRLYSHVVHSALLYAAPIWSERLAESKSLQIPFKRLQKSLALRVIRGYKTVSFKAAILLARIPPLLLLASKQRHL